VQTPELAAEDLNVKVTEPGTIRSSVRGAALLPPRQMLTCDSERSLPGSMKSPFAPQADARRANAKLGEV